MCQYRWSSRQRSPDTEKNSEGTKNRLILSALASKSVASVLLAANMALAPQIFNAEETTAIQVAEATPEIATTTALSFTLPVCQNGKQESRACISGLITAYAKKFGVSQKLALDVAKCESSLRGNVFGDSGKAYGTYQFHKPTFEAFSKEFGEQLDYYNNEDNIKLAIWAFKKGRQYHWTCYDKVTQ